ncbi:hypothetical protein Tco_0435162 [Tanacetum coccineum]
MFDVLVEVALEDCGLRLLGPIGVEEIGLDELVVGPDAEISSVVVALDDCGLRLLGPIGVEEIGLDELVVGPDVEISSVVVATL